MGNQRFKATSIITTKDLVNLTSITQIGYATFANCSALTELVIPATITFISSIVQSDYSITKVFILPATPPSSDYNNPLESSSVNNADIYVPDDSLEAYKTSAKFSRFSNKIKPISEYTG